MRRHPVAAALVGLGVVLSLGLAAFWLINAWQTAQHTLVLRVPPGTAARIAAGEPVEIFPQTLTLKLSEYHTLEVRNDDRVAHTIGPYRIEPGQRFVQHYAGPGTFDLICSLHQSERLRIIVTR